MAIYGVLFGTGAALYGRTLQAVVCLVAAAGGAYGVAALLPRVLAPESSRQP